MERSLEVERKYLADGDVELPDLTGVPGVGSVELRPTIELSAAYYDTPDLRLAAHGLTLRRRSGGDDDGWHLKVPALGGGREEVALPLDAPTADGGVPEPLAALVHGYTLGAELAPVAHIVTTRRRTVLHPADVADGGAEVGAEVSDDRVVVEPVGEAPGEPWREVEVELLGHGRPGDSEVALLDAVDVRLRAAGLAPSAFPSKLLRAFGDRVVPAPALADPPELDPSAPAGEVAMAYVRAQVADLVRWDLEVRRDTHDAVHKMRVAARRLRSHLSTVRPLLRKKVTDPVREELRWLGEVLGHARDAEVMRDRLLRAVADLPPELVVGPVAERVERELGGRYSSALAEAVREMEGQRYATLRARLEELVVAPPLTRAAGEPASDAMPPLVLATRTRVQRAAGEVAAAPTAEQRDLGMHEVRKAAKRARYAGEAHAGVFGPDATAYAKAMERLQAVLGDHQDGVVTRAALRELGLRADAEGESAFTYGVLAGLEEARAERAVEGYGSALDAALGEGLTGWLRQPGSAPAGAG